MIVMKFGGTSVAGAEPLRRVAALVIEQAFCHPVLVVVSAFRGVTDTLLDMAHVASQGGRWEEHWQKIAIRHEQVAEQLGIELPDSIIQLLAELHRFCTGIALLGECTPRMLDAVAVYGELLSSRLLEAYLRACSASVHWHDARRSIKTDAQFTAASVDWSATTTAIQKELLPLFDHYRIVVTQGFIGSTANGISTTLGRGGSDYSAAIFGAVLDATRVEIWTDVSGIFTTDPRQMPNALTLPVMTIGEVTALSAHGAKVIHPLTIVPAVKHQIPVTIRNTFEPDHPGTTIVEQLPSPQPGIRAIVYRDGWVTYQPPPLAAEVIASVRHQRREYYLTTTPTSPNSCAVALVCCVGAMIHDCGVGLQQLAETAQQISCSVQIVASADEYILATVERAVGNIFIEALHEKIRTRLLEIVP